MFVARERGPWHGVGAAPPRHRTGTTSGAARFDSDPARFYGVFSSAPARALAGPRRPPLQSRRHPDARRPSLSIPGGPSRSTRGKDLVHEPKTTAAPDSGVHKPFVPEHVEMKEFTVGTVIL